MVIIRKSRRPQQCARAGAHAAPVAFSTLLAYLPYSTLSANSVK